MIAWISFGVAFLLSLALIPLMRKASRKYGLVAFPRKDRWHQKPMPMLGGVGIFAAFIITLIFIGILVIAQGGVNSDGFEFDLTAPTFQWGFLAGSIIVFILGLYDDLKHISPQAKLVGQIVAAAVVIGMGYSTNFFTPMLANQIVAQLPNILLTMLWLVGITNAVNLLDNMDGLAGGISLITGLILSYFFWEAGDYGLLAVSLALSGSILGFLIFNFPPASIFMGDSGSMFLGFTLAVLAIARKPQASNVFAVLGVPTLLFLLPILDTALVTFTRILRGQSPAQGGRDHASHRLIAFGLTERQVVLILYAVALASGIVAVAIEAVGYWLSLVFVPIIVIVMALFTAFLAGVRVGIPSGNVTGVSSGGVGEKTISSPSNKFARIMLELTYKRRLFEVILDFAIIVLAYYLSFVTRYGLYLNPNKMSLFLQTIPFALAGAYLSFYIFGIYRGVWRYVGIEDLFRYLAAAVGATGIVAATVMLLYTDEPRWSFQQSSPDYSLVIFILFGVYLFIGLAATRSSFKILNSLSRPQTRIAEQRILIYGASDAGEIALRWILSNPDLKYNPLGFIDDDQFKVGRKIHGVEVLGGFDKLESIIERKGIDGLIIASAEGQKILPEGNHHSADGETGIGTGIYVSETEKSISRPDISLIIQACHNSGCWVRTLRLEFELVN